MTATTLIIAWAIAFAFFVVVEVATTGALVSIWLGIGSLFAMFCAIGETPLWVQLLVFVVSSTVMLIVTRPFVKKVLAVKKVNTNADRTIGEIGLVTETIDNTLESGRVMVDGLSWKARASDDSVLEAGTRVQVKEIHGVTLTVEKAV